MAAYVRRDQPEFSWSNRRAELAADCLQAYYQRYYASHNGWEREAPAEARAAYVLGKLSALPQAIGMAVHRRAAECAAAIVAGRPTPSEAAMLARCRAELNALYVSSRDRAAFLANPKQSPMLFELYYRGALAPEEVERTRAKLDTCIAHLARTTVWDDLRRSLACGGEVLVIDSLQTFRVDDVTIYAAPDLVYREAVDGPVVVVDWKSGAWDGAVDAVGVYGILIRDGLGWPLDAGCRGRIVCLGTGDHHEFALDAGDLEEAELRVRASIARMRALMADPDRNTPRPWDAYPLNWRPSRCSMCNYLQTCRARMLAAAEQSAEEQTADAEAGVATEPA